MQGVGKDSEGVLVLGATNVPWGLDSAVRRRFEKRVYIPLPDLEARLALIKNLMTQTPNDLSDYDLEYLAVNTDGFSGADMNILVRDACYEPLRRCQNAKKFKKVGNGWFPCKPSDSQGTELNFMDLEGKNLQLHNVNIVMILN